MVDSGELSIETEHVAVERRLERRQSSVLTTFVLRSACEHPVLVRLADRLPQRVTIGATVVDPDRAPRDWSVTDGWFVVEDVAPADGDRQVSYGYKHDGAERRRFPPR